MRLQGSRTTMGLFIIHLTIELTFVRKTKKNNFTYKLCNINLYEIQHRGSTKESHRRVFDFIHIYSSDCLEHQNFNKLWGNPKCNVPPATRVLKARIPSE